MHTHNIVILEGYAKYNTKIIVYLLTIIEFDINSAVCEQECNIIMG